MPEAREWTRVGLAAALSAAAHVGAAALFGGYEEAETPSPALVPLPPDRVALGIERSDAATITWIGFEEPEPQEAPESTVEQAAQRIGGASARARIDVEQATREATARAQRAATEALRAIERAFGAFELPRGDGEAPREPAMAEAPADETAQAAQEAEPAPAERADRPAEVAGNAEREADAVSIEEPVEIEWGKPIAAKGLEILTRKKGPNYSAYTRVATRPSNPFVEISFGPDGAVRYVDVLKSSGVRDVDRPLVDAIYTWRARGERVDRLAAGDVVKVRLRIVIR